MIRQLGTKKLPDITIIGGSVIGNSIAYNLAERDPKLSITVIEQDPTYQHASAPLSAGGVRQQFSQPANIQMGQYGAEFLLSQKLATDEDSIPDMQFVQGGYLFLASKEGEGVLRANHETQRANNVTNNCILGCDELKSRFPWLNTDGLTLGSLGLSMEGWFDPWSLLTAFKNKAKSFGVSYVTATVKSLTYSKERRVIESVGIRKSEYDLVNLPTGIVINAAGPWAGDVAALCDVPVPVEPRKRSVFTFQCNSESIYSGPSASPLVVDPSGVYFRREGSTGLFITGVSPAEGEEDTRGTSETDLECPDYDLFDENIWPIIAARVPDFEKIKLKNAWAGFYDYNTFDQNAIIGHVPQLKNFVLANGFSGHGLQQAPAVGRAVAELLLDGSYSTIDLSCFSYDRIQNNKPVFEKNIV